MYYYYIVLFILKYFNVSTIYYTILYYTILYCIMQNTVCYIIYCIYNILTYSIHTVIVYQDTLLNLQAHSVQGIYIHSSVSRFDGLQYTLSYQLHALDLLVFLAKQCDKNRLKLIFLCFYIIIVIIYFML